jgi:hypothetical protein
MRSMTRAAVRRGTLVGVLALGLFATPSASAAAPRPPAQPLQDSVIGTGTFLSGVGEAGFDFAATSGPTGESPTGHVIFILPALRIEGTVKCLRVLDANTAIVGIFVPALSQSAFVGITTDGSTQVISIFGFVTNGTIGPGDCPAVILGGSLTVVSGRIVITDAQPFPTTNDQCKNGGWAQFGFKNQGQCVAFVQRGPQP